MKQSVKRMYEAINKDRAAKGERLVKPKGAKPKVKACEGCFEDVHRVGCPKR